MVVRMLSRLWLYFKIGLLRSIEFKGLWFSFYFLDIIELFILTLIFGFVDSLHAYYYYLLYYLVQLQIGFEVWKMMDIKEDIKKGDLLVYITRPLNYLVFRFFYFVGLDITRQLFYGFIVAVIAVASFFASWVNIVTYFLYLLAAWLLEYFFALSLVLIAFFVYEVEQIAKFVNTVKWFFMGGVLPYTFFPSVFKKVTDYTVFSYIGYNKIEALLYPSNIMTLNFWLWYFVNLTIFFSITYVLWNRGLKRFESQGG